MKQKFLIFGIISLILLIFAYTHFYSKNTPPEQTYYTNVIIAMERSSCYGAYPAYSLTFYGNGTIFYEGKNRYVNITGKQTSEIHKEKVKELVDEFYKINYFSLKDKYDQLITDIPYTTTSITINGKYKSVYNRAGAPKELNELENKIDEITNSKQWIKGE